MSHESDLAAGTIQIESYRRMNANEKFHEVFKLREAAWELKRAGFELLHPEWSSTQIESAVKEAFLYATT